MTTDRQHHHHEGSPATLAAGACPAQPTPTPSANWRNAQLSTGPVTPEGKARASQNARTSGWFAQELRVAQDQMPAYTSFEQAWLAELQPEGLLELAAFRDFLRTAWHKEEIIAAQNEATPSSPAAFLDEGLARQLDRLHRYERDFERRAARHLRELRRLQSERAVAAPAQVGSEAASQKRTQSPPAGSLPDSVLAELHVMEVETSHWNAKWRCYKAGLLDLAPPLTPDSLNPPSSSSPAEREAA